MKRALVVVLLLGLSANARADERTPWKVVLGTSLGVTLTGGLVMWHGWNVAQGARDEQCAHGAAPVGDSSCLNMHDPNYTQADLDRSNEQGKRGATIANIGGGMTVVGAALVGVSVYKLLTIKPKGEDRTALVPMVSKHGAGASLTLHW